MDWACLRKDGVEIHVEARVGGAGGGRGAILKFFTLFDTVCGISGG
jgi:hypothetical protein